jgi:hypothetical protein
MIDASLLKLAAIDEEDLAIVSAYAQDAVLKVGDMVYLPAQKRFAIAMNRFKWENDSGPKSHERRRSALVFDRVLAVRTSNINRDNPDGVLELLAVKFTATDNPAGSVELMFAGNCGVQLEVECIETRLTDLGAAWSTSSQPQHAVADEEPDSAG